MTEAWQTANELLQNAEQLEKMLDDHNDSGDLSCSRQGWTAGSRLQTLNTSQIGSFEDLWRRQQLLWEKSQELHKEGSQFMQP